MGDHRACPPMEGKFASSVARRYLRDIGADWNEDVLESALLATSELVTNANIHGGDTVMLAVFTSSQTVRVEVHDSGQTPACWLVSGTPGPGSPSCPRPDDDLSLGGRGLHIVDALSTRWGVTQQPPGKVVWFELNPRRPDDCPSEGRAHPPSVDHVRPRG